MKQTYEQPQLIVTKFTKEDVITTSVLGADNIINIDDWLNPSEP